MNIEISDECFEMARFLANKWGMKTESVIEMLITDRFSSSDQNANYKRRRDAMVEYTKTHEHIDRATAWVHGYNTGWMHFQTRHPDFFIPTLPVVEEE